MKILVAVLMTALFVFAVATAWVDYVQPQLDLIARAAQQKSTIDREPVVKKRTRKVRVEPDDELLEVPTEEVADDEPRVPRRASKTRVAPPRVEDARAMLNDQLEEVKERETRVAARQDSLRMMYDDIRTELAMLDEIRKRASDELIASERGKLETARGPATSREQGAIVGGRPVFSGTPASLKNITGNPANRTQALIMKRLVDDGKEETAVALLKSMKGRDAASVLDSLHSVAPRVAERLAESVATFNNGSARR
jgi:hypothetical protein